MSECNMEELKKEYEDNKANYNHLSSTIQQQLEELIEKHNVNLSVPIESRVKTWKSVSEKVERKKKCKLSEITDLCGIRVISIFRGDIDKLVNIIESNFLILKKEDTLSRLDDSQFGYGSIHFEVSLKEEWCNIPTLKGLKDLVAEIQIRTTSQHIWASASHVLQYKNERNTPPRLIRSINRVAALLEMVDLEFERVLVERENYIASIKDEQNDSELNTDNLKYILDKLLPKENLKSDEDYNDLLDDLRRFDICNTKELSQFVSQNLEDAMKSDKEEVKKGLENPQIYHDIERLNKGVYFAHVGLIRAMLRNEFGDNEFNKVRNEKLNYK